MESTCYTCEIPLTDSNTKDFGGFSKDNFDSVNGYLKPPLGREVFTLCDRCWTDGIDRHLDRVNAYGV